MTRSKVLIAVGYVAPLVVLACVLHLSRAKDVPLHNFLRDPLAVTHSPFYTGAVSNLGIVCWSAALGIALFVSSMRKTDPAARRFFVCFGILTLLLVMDDLYQIHEEVFPRYFGPEQLLLGSYGILTTLVLLGNRRFILAHEYRHLVAAFAFFAVSLAIDTLDLAVFHGPWLLIEDGAKFLGIVAWTIFTAVTGAAEVNGRWPVARAGERPGGAGSPMQLYSRSAARKGQTPLEKLFMYPRPPSRPVGPPVKRT